MADRVDREQLKRDTNVGIVAGGLTGGLMSGLGVLASGFRLPPPSPKLAFATVGGKEAAQAEAGVLAAGAPPAFFAAANAAGGEGAHPQDVKNRGANGDAQSEARATESSGAKKAQAEANAAEGTEGGGNAPASTAPHTGPVSQLEVGPYGPLARRSVGDGLTPDHIPSFASVRANVESQLGRPLTAAEARALRDQTNTIVIRTQTHQQGSRTYGGRNTAQQIQTDSQNLQGAFQADRAALRQRLIQDGHTPEAVDAAFQQLDQLNRQAGRY